MLSVLSLVFQVAMANPQQASDAMHRLAAPGEINQQQLQSAAVADVAHAVLTCYHKTARMQTVQDSRRQFRDASQYGAEGSDLLVIRYSGVTGASYAMVVALMGRGSGSDAQLRAVVLRDTAVIPYARGCPLQDWTSVS